MGRFKKLYLTFIIFLFQKIKLTDGDLGNSKDTDEGVFSGSQTVTFSKKTAIKTDQGVERTRIIIYAYLEKSKIKFEPMDGKEAFRIEKGALKVVVFPFDSDKKLENFGKSTLLGYLKLKEYWVSKPRRSNYCHFKKDPVFIWKKQLVLANLDSQGSVIDIKNAEFSDFKISIARYGNSHKTNMPLKMLDEETSIDFSFHFRQIRIF